MGQIASKQALSLRYWFRQKYNLTPLDARFLEMSDYDIELEYELHLASEVGTDRRGNAVRNVLKTCSECQATTYRMSCPHCDATLSGDKEMDELIKRMEAGEEVAFETLRKGNKTLEKTDSKTSVQSDKKENEWIDIGKDFFGFKSGEISA